VLNLFKQPEDALLKVIHGIGIYNTSCIEKMSDRCICVIFVNKCDLQTSVCTL
jgi:hypothetical protein